MSLNFQLICEQVLLEEDLKDLLINKFQPLINNALKDYTSQKTNPKVDKKLLHNALWKELSDIKKEMVPDFRGQFNIDINTPSKLDQFIKDKQLEFPFLKTLHSQYIKFLN
jgi:hypothetical protein